MVEVYAVKLLEKEAFLSRKKYFINSLPEYLREKYESYSHNDNLQRSIFGELLVRTYFAKKDSIAISELIINQGDKGKPYIKDSVQHFNISHSGKWVVAAFSQLDVGIDIERIREPNYNVAQRFFSIAEIDQLKRENNPLKKRDLFFDFWTIKESYLKAIGTGLTKPLSSFTVNINVDRIVLNDNDSEHKVFIKQLPFEMDYKLSVCSFENVYDEKIKVLKF